MNGSGDHVSPEPFLTVNVARIRIATYNPVLIGWNDHCGRRATTGRLSPREVAPTPRLICNSR